MLYYFQPPPPSARPHVMGYIISYHSYQNIQTYLTSDTKLIKEVPVPTIFILNVCAVNILGKGEGNNVTSESHVLWF